MTKKYIFNVNKNQIEKNGYYFALCNIVDSQKIVRELNEQCRQIKVERNRVNALEEENKQLKGRVDYLERKIQRERNSTQKQYAKWEKEAETKIKELSDENEQLKKDVEYWKQVASQYSNELNIFEHCKKYKTECKDIHWSSD